MEHIKPKELSQKLGQKFAPTDHQAAVIGADPHGASLVVAGAGAGKTETMAARVVWLVANGFARPEEILGLTFTRKAAAELGKRIRSRLQTLANSDVMRDIPADDPRHEWLKNISPAVSTYDSYAGDIVREYGLLIPVEPSARVITEAERWMLTRDLVQEWTGSISERNIATVIQNIHVLSDEMDNHLAQAEEVQEETEAAIANLIDLPPGSRTKSPDGLSGANRKFRDAQQKRLELLPLVQEYRRLLTERNLVTFGQQMSFAAQLVEKNPQVGQEQRRRFRVVMLDEYQDTGHAQRVMLRNLFGQGQDDSLSVTAVGDPMQSIYLFRGATASNLEKFREDFPHSSGTPAQKLELITSWRNPKTVLALANAVSGWSMEDGNYHRLVSELEEREGAADGEVSIAFFDEREEELDWLATHIERRWKSWMNAAAVHGGGDRPYPELESHDEAQWFKEDGKLKKFTAAVLVRKNRDALPIFQALYDRDVPAEMTAGVGLLDIPEVADVFATLRVLVDPEDDVAMLRLLTSPRWNIGASDIAALLQRAEQLNRGDAATGISAEDRAAWVEELHLEGLPETLIDELLEALPDSTATIVGLADALADLGDARAFGISEEGTQRLEELSRELGYLRRHSLPKPLNDLIADIEHMMGLRTEVLTRWHRDREASIGTSHLDAFADIVRSFAELSTANASDLVSYLQAAREHEDGLAPGDVEKKANTVQILTVHKAKGLEWDIVAVPHAERNRFHDREERGSVETWATQAKRIPTTLRGDSEADPRMATMPVLEEPEAPEGKEVTRTEHNKSVAAFTRQVGEFEAKEDDRVFYVGVTRSERVLLVSGAAYDEGEKGHDPAIALVCLRNTLATKAGVDISTASAATFESVPEIEHWSMMGKAHSDSAMKAAAKIEFPSREMELMPVSHELNEQRREFEEERKQRRAEQGVADTDHPVWPQDPVQPLGDILPFFQDSTHQASADVDEETRSQIAAWDEETSLLIEEFQSNATSTVEVPLDVRFTATEAVSLKRDPEEFARRRRRPVPMEPQPYAKRGTAFHNWLENFYGATALLDDEDLPGAADASLADPELERLKQQFLQSEWKDRTPYSVEAAYSVTLEGRVYEGRIDAIFKEGSDPAEGWFVVDWKTGRKPQGKALDAAVLQLAVYRLAWAKVLGSQLGTTVDPNSIRAAFHYVRDNETFEPESLPTAAELGELLAHPTEFEIERSK